MFAIVEWASRLEGGKKMERRSAYCTFIDRQNGGLIIRAMVGVSGDGRFEHDATA